MHYMIHACPQRMWYVEGLLIPSMVEQGIREEEITVWNDTEGVGNLRACLDSFASCTGKTGGTWHLQDDVLLSRDFAEVTKEYAQDSIVCGFCCSRWETGIPCVGEVYPVKMWNSSFPCIYIPNRIAEQFVRWFHETAAFDPDYAKWIRTGKMDDTIFHEFCVQELSNQKVINYAPHLVEHVDYIIGGSTINQWRGYLARGYYFDDDQLVQELTEKVVKLKNQREATTYKSVGGTNEKRGTINNFSGGYEGTDRQDHGYQRR